MISRERLDCLAGQVLPRRLATAVADAANRRTAANYDAVVCTTAFARPETARRHDARRRAEQFTWPRSAAGMLSALAGGIRE